MVPSGHQVGAAAGVAKNAVVENSKQKKKGGMPKGKREAATANMHADTVEVASVSVPDAPRNVAPHEMVCHVRYTATGYLSLPHSTEQR